MKFVPARPPLAVRKISGKITCFYDVEKSNFRKSGAGGVGQVHRSKNRADQKKSVRKEKSGSQGNRCSGFAFAEPKVIVGKGRADGFEKTG